MAEIGAVYDAAPAPRTAADILPSAAPEGYEPAPGPVAANKWLCASVVTAPAAVIGRVFDEAERRDPEHRCNWVALVDGANYLTNKSPYLDYPTALTQGWPMAAGIVEGACRHLVKDRMDITGARWGLAGAEAILKLRALKANGDFEAYWHYHLNQERHHVHDARYLNHAIPSVT